MNNLLSFCGLVDAKIRASDKDLPVNVNFGRLKSKIHSLISLINVETCLLILIFFPPSTVIDFLDFFHPPLLVYCIYVLDFSKNSHPPRLSQTMFIPTYPNCPKWFRLPCLTIEKMISILKNRRIIRCALFRRLRFY